MQLFSERGGARSMGPPAPPQTRRRIAFTGKQRIGIPILALIPVLALLGVFGERSTTADARSASLAVSVQYPVRFRYRQTEALQIVVRNISPRVIDTIEVSIDTAYLTRFTGVHLTPEPKAAFTVQLTGVKPGEQCLVASELQGERYGRHHGRIIVSTPNDSIVVSLRTLVFP